jgi:hypothetical protein
MTDHKATPEEWATIEKLARNNFYAPSCILELRSRVLALEGKYETMRLATLEWGEDVDKLKRWSDQHLQRIMALEANSKPTPNPSQIRSSIQLTPEQEEAIAALLRPDHFGQVNKMVGGSLVERVYDAMVMAAAGSEARAAICEVAAWLLEQRDGDSVAAFVIERECASA